MLKLAIVPDPPAEAATLLMSSARVGAAGVLVVVSTGAALEPPLFVFPVFVFVCVVEGRGVGLPAWASRKAKTRSASAFGSDWMKVPNRAFLTFWSCSTSNTAWNATFFSSNVVSVESFVLRSATSWSPRLPTRCSHDAAAVSTARRASVE